MQTIDRITILDFGSQYTQLIARRIREQGVLAKIVAPETPLDVIMKDQPKGIILSGSPLSTHQGMTVDPNIFHVKLPLLGVCYGMQLMNTMNKGEVANAGRGEYGAQKVSLSSDCVLFKDLSPTQKVWMSHGDSIQQLASCFRPVAHSSDGIIAAMEHVEKQQYGLQFHPEVTHTENGTKIISNFIHLCACNRQWSPGNQIEEIKKNIRNKVGSRKVVSLVSGGVDSTVATILCSEALGADQVYPLHIDSGLMREGESQEVCKLLANHGIKNLQCIDASHDFIDALKGITDPEEKRRIIGTLFIEILEKEMARLDSEEIFFCQGTLYTDLIESGKGCGKNAAVIKTHHNVNPPVVQKKREAGLIIEPNAELFKDEVRALCTPLGIPDHLAWRHPFPGPGLAIRILGAVDSYRLSQLRHADKIYLEEIHKASLYRHIWQAFAVLLPVSTVGVMGDQRREGCAIALRAVTSKDGMTADVFDFPIELLSRISTRIINEVPGVTRVCYDTTSKPPGTIEWE